MKKGDFDKALEHVDKALKLNPEANLYKQIKSFILTEQSSEHVKKKEFDKSREKLEQAWEVSPKKGEKWWVEDDKYADKVQEEYLDYAMKKAKGEKHVQAKAHFKKALEYHQKKDFGKALEHIDKAINLQPEEKAHKFAKTMIFRALEGKHFKQGQFKEALEYIEKQKEWEPEKRDHSTREELIRELAKLGEKRPRKVVGKKK